MKITHKYISSSSLILLASMLAIPRLVAAQTEDGIVEPSPASAPEAETAPAPAMPESWWRDIHIGAKAGLGLANWVGSDASSEIADFPNRPGPTFGLFGSIRLHKQLSLQPELLYAPKGRKAESGGVLSDTFVIDYIEIPLLARFSFPIHDRFAPYVLAGPAMSFLLRYQIESEGDGSITDRTDLARSIDLGVLGGAGTSVVLTGPHALVVEARYERSLTRLLMEDVDVKNRVFSFMIGYQYSLAALLFPRPQSPAQDAAARN